MKFILLICVAILGGCASTKNTYVAPEDTGSNMSTMANSWTRNGLMDWEGFSVESIDNKYVSYGVSDRDWITIRIAEGTHNLVVHGEFNRSIGDNCPCQAFGQLEFTAQAGIKYKLVGEVQGVNIRFWIVEKETGEQKSSIASVSYATSPKQPYVPIYIPVN